MKTIEIISRNQKSQFTTKSVTFSGKEYFYAKMSNVRNNEEKGFYSFSYDGQIKGVPYEPKDAKTLAAIFSQVSKLQAQVAASAQAPAATKPVPAPIASQATDTPVTAADTMAASENIAKVPVAQNAEASDSKPQQPLAENAKAESLSQEKPLDAKAEKKAAKEKLKAEKQATKEKLKAEKQAAKEKAKAEKKAAKGNANAEKQATENNKPEGPADSIASTINVNTAVAEATSEGESETTTAGATPERMPETTATEATPESKPETTAAEAASENNSETTAAPIPTNGAKSGSEKKKMDPEKKTKLKKSFSIFGIVLAVILVLAVLYFFIFGTSSAPTLGPNSTESQQYNDIDELINDLQ